MGTSVSVQSTTSHRTSNLHQEMGSSFSIHNDTSETVWVSHGVHVGAIIGGVSAGLGVATLGVGLAAGAAAGATGAATTATSTAAASTMVGTMEGVVFTSLNAAGLTAAVVTPVAVGGLTAAGWGGLATITGILSIGTGVASTMTGTHKQKALKAKEELEKALKDYVRIDPGQTYGPYEGTVSLVQTGYVIKNNGKMVTSPVWTAPTAGSDHQYKMSEYFC